MEIKIKTFEDLTNIKNKYLEEQKKYSHQVLVCSGAGCISSDCVKVRDAAIEQIQELGLEGSVNVLETGCMGTCSVGPVILILPERIFYTKLDPDKTKEIIKAHITENNIIEKYTFFDYVKSCYVPKIDDIDFFKEQVRIALRNCGVIEYNNINSYIANNGYMAAAKALTDMSPEILIEEVKNSGLRGRGGAGFPTGIKWEAGLRSQSDVKYMVCNADEGDPGAFMDRSIIEGDPHTLIEGMMLGAYAIGASKGYVYIRAEYPIAVERLNDAINEAKEYGLLGKNIFGSDFNFELEIRIGAGAFVCGEETALLASIEGKRGEPSQKPPFPFEKGLFEKPTIINNVETLANIPPIVLNGGSWYAGFGTEKAKGTKVFALAGNIVNTGIIEVPIGIPLGEILFNIGGGMIGKKEFKAAQIGGPSGGCITRENLNVSTDYESLTKLGAIMGSGGLIAMNEDTCMVDTARYFMEFVCEESCGKCTACRVGTKRMLEILERITSGKGQEGDIELLEELGNTIKKSAMCGLGQTAPNPVLSTIKYFREEYEEHINDKYCRAGVCSELFISPCENTCPANINIPGYLALIANGRFTDAYDLIYQENPMPSICGRVCTHPCESKCRRGAVDDPIAICDLKRFVSDYTDKNRTSAVQYTILPKKEKHVSVVGGGPSGLTCAYYLSRLGYDVDVYEALPVAGGMLAIGIPEYRLPMEVLQKEISHMRQSGFNLYLNTKVGVDITLDDIVKQSDAVYMATGLQAPQKMNIPGEELEGVISGIDFLKNTKLSKNIELTGKTVAIIGGGNTAIDSARSALRLGAQKVMILYRRRKDDMPAFGLEIQEAVHEGVEIYDLISPLKIIGEDNKVTKLECVKREMSNFDKNGRRNSREIKGSNFFVEADVVIPAVSQVVDIPLIKRELFLPFITGEGVLHTDPATMKTSMTGVFAGGDASRGSDTVIKAIADGKRAAIQIDLYLGGNGTLNKGKNIDIPQIIDEDEVTTHERFEIDLLPLEKRNSFNEVVLGFHKINAMAEAMRCLHCDRR